MLEVLKHMITSNLANEILFKPAKLTVDRIFILSGYATPNMVSYFMKNVKPVYGQGIEVHLSVGMVPLDGLSIAVHEGFKVLMHDKLPAEIKSFECSYLRKLPPVHSNLYIWCIGEVPIVAFTGSANFTQAAFNGDQRECMVKCDPHEAMHLYQSLINETTYCNHAEIEEEIMLKPTHEILDRDNRPKQVLSGAGIESVTISLLTNKKTTGHGSRLNWGHRRDGTIRNLNEAYIGVPSKVARKGFFPHDERHFTVVTDDQRQLILRIEQGGRKAITTPLSNAQLGEYFRNRLGLPNGAFITIDHLHAYGRTDVTFYKFDDEQYLMDFSV